MPTSPAPTRQEMFNDAIAHRGRYLTDTERVPHFNPSDSDEAFHPGEPIVKQWGQTGTAADSRVFQVQGPIFPGEIGYLVKNFKAEFDCGVNANVVQGDEVYWDLDNNDVRLEGQVTNGFLLGHADFTLDPNLKNDSLTLDGNDRVICATSSSDKIVVQSLGDTATTTKGTVTIFGMGAKDKTQTKKVMVSEAKK